MWVDGKLSSSVVPDNILLQDPRTQIDAFQMNMFSWLDDILTKIKLFLESWDGEIW